MRLYYYFIIFMLFLLRGFEAGAQVSAFKSVLDKARLIADGNYPDSALAIADSVIPLALINKDHVAQVSAMEVKGKALFNLKRNKEAVDLYFQALGLCRQPDDNLQTAMLYKDIGYACFSQGHYGEAKENYEKELEIRRALYGEDSLVKPLINLSVMCEDMAQYDSAAIKLNEVDKILAHNENADLRGYFYLNKGALLQLEGKPDSTEWYYHKAWDAWKTSGNIAQIYKVTFNLGFLAEQKKDYRLAINYYRLSEEAARKYGFMREIAHVYGTMAEAYAALKDYHNAYDNLYNYAQLNDSLSQDEFNNYVVKLDKQFQADKNRETIQQQQLKLDAANLEVQQKKNQVLLIIVILVLVLAAGGAIFTYFTFKSRLQKQLDAAKGRFFADVVHEIRTPLSMILGPVKVLQSKISDPGLLSQLSIAERNTTRLSELITQMLDISKIENARYQLHEGIGNPGVFLDEMIKPWQTLASEKKLDFSITLEMAPGNVYFDRDAIEKIIGNLVGNALKYTPAGGAAGIDASGKSVSGNLYNLTISIWDTGPGISKEDQQKIFDRFYRTPETQGAKGAGIGLSLVKDLVNLMGGHIVVESEKEKGAVFTVTFNLKQFEQQEPAKEEFDDRKTMILLAEDDKDILDFNAILLKENGYGVITAPDGIKATALLNDHLPDLVITDLMMPGKDGLALLKEIRSNAATAHLPVVILSARSSAETRLEVIEGGAQVYLTKPFQPAELLAAIKSQLQLIGNQQEFLKQHLGERDKPVEERFEGTDPFTLACFNHIRTHLDDAQFSVEKLADLMNINRSHFQRKIKTLTGYSPSELIRKIRLEKAREMLQRKEGNITETAYATGFTSQSYFSKCFADYFGYPPGQQGR